MSYRNRLILLFSVLGVVVIGSVIWYFRAVFNTSADMVSSGQNGKSEEAKYVPDEIIVKFKKVVTEEEIKTKVDKNKIGDLSPLKSAKKVFEQKELANTYVLNVDLGALSAPADETTVKNPKLDNLIAALIQDPDVEYAEKNVVISTSLDPDDPYYSSAGSWGQTYSDLWGLQKIETSTAWDGTTGSDSIIVGVIDSGIDYNHPDLKDNILLDSTGTVVGWDFANNDADPIDDNGHGTHVAGTIGATGNNTLGVVGVNWKVKIMPVKVFGTDGSGNILTAANAVTWATDHGAKILNNSYGGLGTSQTMANAVRYATDHNVLMVASAGNSNDDTSKYSPASVIDTMAVSAYDSNDAKAYFSNYGMKIEAAAPGVSVLSLKAAVSPVCSGTTVAENYCVLSGTSMSSPHVAGLAALIWSKNPTFTNEQVRQAIKKGADDVSAAGWDNQSGYGRINAASSLLVEKPLSSRIRSVVKDPTNVKIIHINGFASGPDFSSYDLYYSAGKTPTSWVKFASSTTQVNNAELGKLDMTGLAADFYTFKVVANNTSQGTYEDLSPLIGVATVQGKVTSSSGKGISKATVRIQNLDCSWYNCTQITGRDGSYSFNYLPVGSYTFTAEASGYVTSSATPANAYPLQSVLVNFSLNKAITKGGGRK